MNENNSKSLLLPKNCHSFEYSTYQISHETNPYTGIKKNTKASLLPPILSARKAETLPNPDSTTSLPENYISRAALILLPASTGLSCWQGNRGLLKHNLDQASIEFCAQ